MIMINIFSKKEYWLDLLKIKEDDLPDSMLIYGSLLSAKIIPLLEKSITKISDTGLPNLYFGEYNNKKILYGTAFGPSIAATFAHLAGILKFNKIILIGSCGAISQSSNSLIIPSLVISDDSVTKWYYTNNKEFFPEKKLINLAKNILKKKNIISDFGKVITISNMLMETEKDINHWNDIKVMGVDMESAPIVAIANYFKIGSLSILVKAEQLKGDKVYPTNKEKRIKIRDEIINCALEILCN